MDLTTVLVELDNYFRAFYLHLTVSAPPPPPPPIHFGNIDFGSHFQDLNTNFGSGFGVINTGSVIGDLPLANGVGSTFTDVANGAGSTVGPVANGAGSTFGPIANEAGSTVGPVANGAGSTIGDLPLANPNSAGFAPDFTRFISPELADLLNLNFEDLIDLALDNIDIPVEVTGS